jgi:D-arginine dehydrogenase
MISFNYVIIGAGFAGAATAYHLTRRGVTDILILEQESIPGYHSSGRNAAMIRQCVSDPALLGLTGRGAAFLRNCSSGWPVLVDFKRNGSLLLGSGAGWERLRQDAELGRTLGIEAELWSPARAKKHVPALEGAEFDGAVWCGTDGIIDIHALLSGYLKAATANGARIGYGNPVTAIEAAPNGVLELVTPGEKIKTKVLINASGAWANTIGQMAGAAALPLRPCRRHLVV